MSDNENHWRLMDPDLQADWDREAPKYGYPSGYLAFANRDALYTERERALIALCKAQGMALALRAADVTRAESEARDTCVRLGFKGV